MKTQTATSRRLSTALALGAAAVACAAPVAAHAQLSSGDNGGAGGGGTYSAAPPAITEIVCEAGCAGLEKVKAGSSLRLSGVRMESARKVSFLGRRGGRDDTEATVITRDALGLTVKVPPRSRSGRLRVVGADGKRSKPSPRPVQVVRSRVKGARLEARAAGRGFVFTGQPKAALRYFVGASGAAQVKVELARKGDAVALASWTHTAVEPGSVRTVDWDGRFNGAQAPDGAYEFRVRAVGSAGRSAQNGTVVAGFSVLSYAFPILGEHRFGTGAGRFGAGRDGGSHQGQDVFAKCGTPLVAARGGVVIKRGRQSAAGNYLVIDTDQDPNDHVYMHLRAAALVSEGTRVTTGQPIGEVGQTGRASGCHLHFEAWPSGYLKGSPIDPRPLLKSWDK